MEDHVASVNIRPLEDKIVVQASRPRRPPRRVSSSRTPPEPQEGTVVAGPDRWDEDGGKRIPLDVAEGDTVIYSKYGGTEIKVQRRGT